MININKLRANTVIDFAAEELKKYLRMMMPEAGDLAINYAPGSTDGLRLGLLSDFSLDESEVDDPVLDDVVHIDTDTEGGILAGSNPRSVLFAVYRYLKLNGCRFLYPGVDGELIPVRDIEPQKYHHKAHMRYRGQSSEGTEYAQCMLESIDFYAKLEMNTFMLEFDNPFVYYDRYFSHHNNEANRAPEPITYDTAKQYKRLCEVEMAKRGLQFHDMGHGWTAEPFGISSKKGWTADAVELTDEQRRHLALFEGKRDLYRGIALNTNLCMSNPETRALVVKSIVEYSASHSNVTYLHVWLADGTHNHCECEECIKRRPSDYYIMMMNEADEALTAAGLDTKLVFICYIDTMFAPETEVIKNPDRFSLLYAPITRSYTKGLSKENIPAPAPYLRNKWEMPKSAEENAAFLLDWQRLWKGNCFTFEYHFWKHTAYDPGQMTLARRIFDDIRDLPAIGLSGIVENGSQRVYFPSSLALYVYAEALLNAEVTFDEICEDYFSHTYGEEWKAVRDYLESISEKIDFAFMEGEATTDRQKGKYYDPERANVFNTVPAICDEIAEFSRSHRNMPYRVQNISMRLLERHSEYCSRLSESLSLKAKGEHKKSKEVWELFRDSFGRYEYELERYFDHGMVFRYTGLVEREMFM